eukprot:2968979-Alexandrium_andersonii.AAC.2
MERLNGKGPGGRTSRRSSQASRTPRRASLAGNGGSTGSSHTQHVHCPHVLGGAMFSQHASRSLRTAGPRMTDETDRTELLNARSMHALHARRGVASPLATQTEGQGG